MGALRRTPGLVRQVAAVQRPLTNPAQQALPIFPSKFPKTPSAADRAHSRRLPGGPAVTWGSQEEVGPAPHALCTPRGGKKGG